MAVKTVGILSPGQMGSAVGKALGENGFDVITCLAGRSEQTRKSAAASGFRSVADMETLVREADLVLSILVPAEATGVAKKVAAAMTATGAKPPFADCNAVSPQTARAMAPIINAAGGAFIDAGIIGGPPRAGYAPRVYASGPAVSVLAELDGRGISVVPVGDEIGRASAIKMCYAAGTKGTTALQTALLIAAERLGVYEELCAELMQSQRGVYERMEASAKGLHAVAYRFIGEMEEIAATFEAVGVTGSFHRGAADIFRLVASVEAPDSDSPDKWSLHESVCNLARRIPA